MKTSDTSVEIGLADEIVSVLPAGSCSRVSSPGRGLVAYSVDAPGLRLQSVVFSRDSLARLASDPTRAIKVEYLQRDLTRSARRRAEFRYPRLTRASRAPRRSAVAAMRSMAATLPLFA